MLLQLSSPKLILLEVRISTRRGKPTTRPSTGPANMTRATIGVSTSSQRGLFHTKQHTQVLSKGLMLSPLQTVLFTPRQKHHTTIRARLGMEPRGPQPGRVIMAPPGKRRAPTAGRLKKVPAGSRGLRGGGRALSKPTPSNSLSKLGGSPSQPWHLLWTRGDMNQMERVRVWTIRQGPQNT